MLHHITDGVHSQVVVVERCSFTIELDAASYTIQNDQDFVNSLSIYLFLFIY